MTRRLLFILLGPAVLGAAIGLRFGVQASLARGLSTPAIIVGVALLMMPALYIGAAISGIAPSAGEVLASAVGSLRATSVIYLGLAPALAFLVATAESKMTVVLLGSGALAIGVLLGLRDLYLRLFTEADTHSRAFPLFAAWALVSMGIGGQLFMSSLAG